MEIDYEKELFEALHKLKTLVGEHYLSESQVETYNKLYYKFNKNHEDGRY